MNAWKSVSHDTIHWQTSWQWCINQACTLLFSRWNGRIKSGWILTVKCSGLLQGPSCASCCGGRVESAESTLHFVRKCPTPFGAFFALLSSFSTRLFSTKNKLKKKQDWLGIAEFSKTNFTYPLNAMVAYDAWYCPLLLTHFPLSCTDHQSVTTYYSRHPSSQTSFSFHRAKCMTCEKELYTNSNN